MSPRDERTTDTVSVYDAERIMTAAVGYHPCQRTERRMLQLDEMCSVVGYPPERCVPIAVENVPFSAQQLEEARDTHMLVPIVPCCWFRQIRPCRPLVFDAFGDSWWQREVLDTHNFDAWPEWWLLPLGPSLADECAPLLQPAPCDASLVSVVSGYRLPTTQAMICGALLYYFLRGRRLFPRSALLTEDARTGSLDAAGYFSPFGTLRFIAASCLYQVTNGVHLLLVPEPHAG